MKSAFTILSCIVYLIGFSQKGKTYSSIAEAWKNPSNVYILDLENDNLNSIPKEIFYMTNLEELYLEKNRIVKIPKEIGLLTHLRILDIDQNKIDSVPSEIGKLIELRELDLDQNDLVYLPSEIGNLKRLRSLDLHDNLLVSLPKEIGLLDTISEIYIYKNKLESLPDEFYHLIKLTQLNLDDNSIERIDKGIGLLKDLTHFSAKNNHLIYLDESIVSCQSIREINLSFNKLSEIPKGLGDITNLTTLYLNNNSLDSLPAGFGEKSQINKFILDFNRLKKISIKGEMKYLKYFSLRNNQIQKFTFAPTEFPVLSELFLSNNLLLEISTTLTEIKSLSQLDLSNNQIKTIPSDLSNWTNLRKLDLKNNSLEKFPESVGKLYNLSSLDLFNNPLKKELKGVEKLTSLYHLSISETQLNLLPKSIKKLEGLDNICIDMAGDNCIRNHPNHPSTEVSEQEPEKIPEIKIDLSKKGWIEYLINEISGNVDIDEKYPGNYEEELYRQLRLATEIEDLIPLLNHPDFSVKIYAFRLLDEKRYSGLFEFIKNHIHDEVEIKSKNHWDYTFQLGKYYVNANTLNTKQRFHVDSLILFTTNFIEDKKRILTTYDTITSFHDSIVKMAKTNNEAALYLAKYQRKSDLKVLQNLLYSNPYNLSGISEIFPDPVFISTIEQLLEENKYSISILYSLVTYKNKPALELLDEFVTKVITSDSTKKNEMKYLFGHLEYKNEPYFDSLYLKLWEYELTYPDTLILKRMIASQPEKSVAILKKLLIKNPPTYYNEKMIFCLKSIYESDPQWAIPFFCKAMEEYGKNYMPYHYGDPKVNYFTYARKHPTKEFISTMLKVFDSDFQSFIEEIEITKYVLSLKDEKLNEELLNALVNRPHIYVWDANEIKSILKKENLLDELILLQEERKLSLYGKWRIESWKYGTKEKKAPNWAYLELGTANAYLIASCTSQYSGNYHFDSTILSFDSIVQSNMNWADTYVDVNHHYRYVVPALATSAVPELISICRDTSFDDAAIEEFTFHQDKILVGDMKYHLSDSVLHLKGNGEMRLKLIYDYYTDWKKPIAPKEVSSYNYDEYVVPEFKLSNPPKDISGIPIERYLARNDIDSLSKLFIQGKLSLKQESYEDNRYLLDSVHTQNPYTKNFYFYLFNRMIGQAKTMHYYSQLREDLSGHCSRFLIEDPCYFFQMVKSGPYAYQYFEWKKYFQRGLWEDALELLQQNGIEYQLKASCSKYISEFKNIIKWMETYEDPDIPYYDEH